VAGLAPPTPTNERERVEKREKNEDTPEEKTVFQERTSSYAP
jgi:hypothetical protein